MEHVFTGSPELSPGSVELAPLPLKYDLDAGATQLMLSGMALGFQRGQAIAFPGEQADAAGVIRNALSL